MGFVGIFAALMLNCIRKKILTTLPTKKAIGGLEISLSLSLSLSHA
jgi:hypothetical protein